MCCPIGITWACGCDFRSWIRCFDSEKGKQCGMEDLVKQGPPPPLFLYDDDPDDEILRKYWNLCGHHQTHLRLLYCCTPECCQLQLLHHLQIPQERASEINGVHHHIDLCCRRFEAQVGKLNNMRFAGEPLKGGAHISNQAIEDVLRARGPEVNHATNHTAFVRLRQASLTLQSSSEIATHQFAKIRYYAFKNIDSDIQSTWKPPPTLLQALVFDENWWDKDPLWQRTAAKSRFAGYVGLNHPELYQVRMIYEVIRARAAAKVPLQAGGAGSTEDQPATPAQIAQQPTRDSQDQEANTSGSIIGVGLHTIAPTHRSQQLHEFILQRLSGQTSASSPPQQSGQSLNPPPTSHPTQLGSPFDYKEHARSSPDSIPSPPVGTLSYSTDRDAEWTPDARPPELMSPFRSGACPSSSGTLQPNTNAGSASNNSS